MRQDSPFFVYYVGTRSVGETVLRYEFLRKMYDVGRTYVSDLTSLWGFFILSKDRVYA